jgi:DNA-binding PadR family transcriptional regulator
MKEFAGALVHKQLMLLGFLLRGPRHGYELHQMIKAHGELYSDLKKANVYYLLEKLAEEGCVRVRTEGGARGPRGERLVYAVTPKGRRRFEELLRAVLSAFEPAHIGIEVAAVFLNHLRRSEVLALLGRRREVVAQRRRQVAADLGDLAAVSLPVRLAADHILGSIDGELAWIDRAGKLLRDERRPPRARSSKDHG